MRLVDGDYQIDIEVPCDRGYGVEATSDCIVIYVVNGDIDEVIGYGLHYTTELDIDWDVDITDGECLDLLKKHRPDAFRDYTKAELDDIHADNQLDLYKDK